MSDTDTKEKIHVELGKFETPEESTKELSNFTDEVASQALIMSGEQFKALVSEAIQDAYNLGAYDNRCYSRKKIHKELTLVLYRKIDSELRDRYENEYVKKLDELKKENHDLNKKTKERQRILSWVSFKESFFPWFGVVGTAIGLGVVLGQFVTLF